MAEYAPGIPDKYVYGEPTKALEPGQLATYVLQHHRTKRRPGQPHYDLRIGTPGTNLFSWAIPGAELPEPGKKKLAPQTQLHTFAYGNYEGPIREGYGAGHVGMADKGQVLIRKVQPNSVHFTIAHTKVPVRYSLVNIGGKNGRDWLLVHKAQPRTVTGVGDKPKYKLIEATDLDDALEQATQVQEKIDGAHQIYQLGDRGAVEAYSVNPRTTGEPILHTERVGLSGVQAPAKLKGTTLRGEVYAVNPKGRAIPFQELSGLLNANIAKSIETQRARKLKIRHAIFDVIQHKGQDVSQWPLAERQKLVQEIVGQLPKEQFHVPQTATGEGKAKLLEDIRAGKNPRTSEGIMLHTPEGKVIKFKLRPESRGYITGTFPGKAGRTGLPGGVTFAGSPEGKEMGRLGSGFTLDELKDIAKNLEAYKRRPMRITHMGKFPAGTLRAPVFSGWETDVKAAQAPIELPWYIQKLAPNVDVPKVPVTGSTTNLSANVAKQLQDSWRMQMVGADKDVAKSNKGLTEFYSKMKPNVQQQMDKAVSGYVAPYAGQSVNAAEFGPGLMTSVQKAIPGITPQVAAKITAGQGAAAAQQFAGTPAQAPVPTAKAPAPAPAPTPATPAARPVGAQLRKGASMKVASSPLVRSIFKAMFKEGQQTQGYAGYGMAPDPDSGKNPTPDPAIDFNRMPMAAQPGPMATPFRNPSATPGLPPSVVANPGSNTVAPGEVNRIQSLKNPDRTAPKGQMINQQETT